jgi:hypothetical protein
MSRMAAKKTPAKPRLSVEQLEIVGAFSDYTFEYPNLDFEAVARKVIGVRKPFPNTPTGRLLRRECKQIFDRERAK